MPRWHPARPGAGPEREAELLVARVTLVAGRLADLLVREGSEASGAHAAAEFVRSWMTSVTRDAHFFAEPLRTVERGGDHPLDRLADRFGFSDPEIDLLLLAGLPEEHEGIAATVRRIHPSGEPHPTVGIAALLVAERIPSRSAFRRLLAEGPAVRCGALRVEGPGSFYERSLRVADGLWGALHGHDVRPTALEWVDAPATAIGLDGWVDLEPVRRAVTAVATDRPHVLVIPSDDEPVALSRAVRLLQAAGAPPLVARAGAIDRDALGMLALHAAVRGAVPVLVLAPADGGSTTHLDVAGVPGPLVVCAAPGSFLPPLDRAVVPVPLGPVTTADRRDAWRAALPQASERAAELAGRHPLDPAVTAQVALDVEGNADLASVSAAIRSRAGVSLPDGAELLTPRADWSRLVLRSEVSRRLQDAVARLQYQGVVLDDWGMADTARADRGIRLLFSGAPGTGKSLAAEVVARAAATDLLVVDVSRVVSKWIGETEKNLAAVFDVAERTRSVLLLDEADALFASRTEISDSHDRYANLQTAWLLQRLDHFDGMAVLATNLRRNVDAAFIRRMDYVIEFELPDDASRHLIWQAHLPPARCGSDVDLEVLARRYPVPGGWIRNAAIEAAYAAAAEGVAIGQRHLVEAMRLEYEKAIKPFPGPDPVPLQPVPAARRPVPPSEESS